jgi:hypothetical protein
MPSFSLAPRTAARPSSFGAALRERARRTLSSYVGSPARNGEAVALSTCNRTELYVVDKIPEVAQERAFAEHGRRLQALSESEIAPSLYTLSDEAAAPAPLPGGGEPRLADPGEAQILGQVRGAYETAKEAGTAGRSVHGSSARPCGWGDGCGARRPSGEPRFDLLRGGRARRARLRDARRAGGSSSRRGEDERPRHR